MCRWGCTEVLGKWNLCGDDSCFVFEFIMGPLYFLVQHLVKLENFISQFVQVGKQHIAQGERVLVGFCFVSYSSTTKYLDIWRRWTHFSVRLKLTF